MAKSPFSIFTRKGSDGKSTFCARFYDDDGGVLRTMTLSGARSRTSAARIAEGKLRDGVVSRPTNPDALVFIRTFWTRDSDYVQGRALRGTIISAQYLKNNVYLVEKHAAGALKGKRLLDVSPALLEKLILSMSRAGASARTINTTLQALRVPVAHFCKLHRLANALTSIEKLKETPHERGILSAEEVGRIIALEGGDQRAVAGALLGALCGLRLGEVRGLQWSDVDPEAHVIQIRHNFVGTIEGLKGPKWNSVRSVPAPQPVLDALQLCKDTDLHGSAFCIWNERAKNAAVDSKTIRAGFYRILEAIGIPDAERERRNLLFHGLRHTFVSLSRAGGVPDFIVQRLAGHKSLEMTNRYSHTEGVLDFQTARAALEAAVAPGTAGGAK